MSAEVTTLEGGTRPIMPATSRPTADPTTEVTNTTTVTTAPSLSQSVASDPPRTVVAPTPASVDTGSSNKRNSQDNERLADAVAEPVESGTQAKRVRAEAPAVKILPKQYEDADPNDIVILIASMLMELIRFNDKIPLHQGRLTRFHSRSPPRISVLDYLRRLTTHATLSPPILLSMVYYIDRLCALYPAFTVSSLTIHRFLITSATVASKGLSDSFWTNKTYARVGGISLTELAMLELEFLFRVEWRIVPQPEVLVDYYQSLVERCDGYEIERAGSEAQSAGRTPSG